MNISTHWFGFIFIGFALLAYSTVTVWFLPESPVYLLSMDRFEELEQALQ